MRVLFVCTGNICRSPTAEGVFRHLVGAAGLQGRIETDSCGTHGYHIGDPPDPRSIAAAARQGVGIDDLRARSLTQSDFTRFDLLLAMDNGHLRHLRRSAPRGAEDRAALFLDFTPDHRGADVPDPYYGPLPGFDEVFALIHHGASHLLTAVQARLA